MAVIADYLGTELAENGWRELHLPHAAAL